MEGSKEGNRYRITPLAGESGVQRIKLRIFARAKKGITQRFAEANQRRGGGHFTYIELWGFHNESTLSRRNVNHMSRHLNSVQECASVQVTTKQVWGMANVKFKKLMDQNEDSEQKIQVLENQLGGSSKVITDQNSGAGETKGRTMEMGVTKIEKGVDSRNPRGSGIIKRKSVARIRKWDSDTEFPEVPDRNRSSGSDRNRHGRRRIISRRML